MEDSRPTTQDIEIEVTLKVGETVRGYLSEGYAGKQVIGKTEEAVRGDMKPQAPLYEIIIRRIE
ncbi:MAG: hypothetical protein KKD18_06025 [Nanoarchaeota archaeon]|nr:hypothetical protein [Nanoarchaeota archaeon]MBU0977949.1 hypothetical protein [Nanoarchaeota archaeon]